ncbi:MAG TPA: hypothetical protein VGD98_19410 [Ktedonobacteraceae bacterium]
MRDQRTYFWDLPTLLTYLRGQSCELTTELKISGKAARGSIVLEKGTIMSCQLVLQNGMQINGEQAYKKLETCTQWQVELEARDKKEKTPSLPPSPTQPFSPSGKLPSSTGNAWYVYPLR